MEENTELESIELTKIEQKQKKKLVNEFKKTYTKSEIASFSRKEVFYLTHPRSYLKRYFKVSTDESLDSIIFTREYLARAKQFPPNSGKYRVWIVNAGRGFGKTWVGAQELIYKIMYEGVKRTSIIGRTFDEAINVMVLGQSGILALAPENFKPDFKNNKLYWPNGAITLIYSAEKPDSMRGIQNEFVWADEVAAYRYPEIIDQMILGLRLGKSPCAVFTTTPRPVKWFKYYLKKCTDGEKGYFLTNGSTFENKSNLAEDFITDIISSYPKGSLMAEQELYGKVVDESADALFKLSIITEHRVPSDYVIDYDKFFDEIIVAIDPSVTANAKSDLAGVVVVGRGFDNHYYVIKDASGVMKTEAWSKLAVELYHKYNATKIVAEVNNGGDLVENAIKAYDPYVKYESVRATRGKKLRAEPISSLYFHGTVHHIGYFDHLETEMCGFSGLEGEKSPDRMDALVWGLTKLLEKGRSSFLQFVKNKLKEEEIEKQKKEMEKNNKANKGKEPVAEIKNDVQIEVIKKEEKPAKKTKWSVLLE